MIGNLVTTIVKLRRIQAPTMMKETAAQRPRVSIRMEHLPFKIKDYYVELCNIRDGKQGVIPRQQPILPNLPDDYKDYVNKSKKTKKK